MFLNCLRMDNNLAALPKEMRQVYLTTTFIAAVPPTELKCLDSVTEKADFMTDIYLRLYMINSNKYWTFIVR